MCYNEQNTCYTYIIMNKMFPGCNCSKILTILLQLFSKIRFCTDFFGFSLDAANVDVTQSKSLHEMNTYEKFLIWNVFLYMCRTLKEILQSLCIGQFATAHWSKTPKNRQKSNFRLLVLEKNEFIVLNINKFRIKWL